MFRDFFSLVFPRNCLNCHTSLMSEEQFLCLSCKTDLPKTDDFQFQENDLFRKYSFEPKIKTAAAFLYFHQGGVTQKLLHHLKYKGKQELGISLGSWFAELLVDINVDFILPVPLHKSKVRVRSYNQSEKIAEGMGKKLDAKVRIDLAKRIISTTSQTRKSKVERWKNMENVYSISEDLFGKSVLVVDDVITTGATVGMLCERLVEANVESIHIACIARGK